MGDASQNQFLGRYYPLGRTCIKDATPRKNLQYLSGKQHETKRNHSKRKYGVMKPGTN